MAEEVQFTDEVVYNGGINEADAPTKIKDNQWVSSENVEPLPDGVRRRLGYTNENTIQLPAIDESHETGTSSRLFVDGTAEYIAQGFQLSATANCAAVEVRLKVGAGSPTVALNCAIYTDSAGDPNAVITGLDTSDFSSVAAASLGASYKWFRFSVATPVSLTLSTQYHLVISQIDQSAGNEAAIEEVTTPSGYTSGSVGISPSVVSWTNVPAADLNFRVFTATADITAIKDYNLSDASTEYHMVFAGQHLYKNNGDATMTPVSQLPRVNEYVASKDTHPSMVVANDRLMLTDGTDPSQQFYVQSSVEYYENVGIEAPTTTETVAVSAGAGNAADGDYYIDYYFYNSRTGQSSRRRYNGVKAAKDVTGATSKDIVITGLPTTAEGRTNDAATSIRIECKGSGPAAGSGGSSAIYRTLADASGDPIDVTLGTATYTITSANTYTTAARYDDNVPPRHSFKIIAENRQFFGGNPTYPWRLYFSKIAGGVPYYESVPSTNYRDFGRGDGDYMTAYAYLSPRTLIVGFKNSIFAIDARNPGVSDRLRIASGIGIANHQSLVVTGNTIYFVSDADKRKGMFRWSPGMTEPEPLLGIDDTFQNLSQTRLDNCSCAYYAKDDNRHQWWTTVSGAAQSGQTKILVYDTELDAWTDYNIAANVVGIVEESSVLGIYLGQDGYEAQADSGSTDNGTTISSSFKSKTYLFNLYGTRKKSRFIDYIAARKSQASIVVALEADEGGGAGASTLLSFPELGNAFVLGTSTLGSTAVLGGGTGDYSGRAAVRVIGRLLSYEYSSTTDFHLKSVSYGIQKTGRR